MIVNDLVADVLVTGHTFENFDPLGNSDRYDRVDDAWEEWHEMVQCTQVTLERLVEV